MKLTFQKMPQQEHADLLDDLEKIAELGYTHITDMMVDHIIKVMKKEKLVKSVLKKDAGQIKFPKMPHKLTRPEQEVSRLKEQDPYHDKKGALYGQEAWLPSERTSGTGGEYVQDFSGEYKKPYAIVGHKASRSTEQHEGFHVLTNKLVQMHGVDAIHGFYKNLLNEVHPKIDIMLGKVLRTNTNYARMEVHPDKRYQLAFLEEKINLLHDFVHGGKDSNDGRRDQLFDRLKDVTDQEQNGKPGYFKNLTGFEDAIEYDNHLKLSWKRLRDKANNSGSGDL